LHLHETHEANNTEYARLNIHIHNDFCRKTTFGAAFEGFEETVEFCVVVFAA